MLGEFAFADIDLAAPANGAATAYRVDVHAQAARGMKHGCAHGKAPTLAGGSEDDKGILVRHEGQTNEVQARPPAPNVCYG